jgi:hypothetical protein
LAGKAAVVGFRKKHKSKGRRSRSKRFSGSCVRAVRWFLLSSEKAG